MYLRLLVRLGCCLLPCGLLAVAVLAAEPSSPSQNVSLSMDRLAEIIAACVKEQGRDEVMLGPFADSSKVPSNAGPGIVQLLSQSLNKQGIKVRDKAALEVRGKYFTDVDPKWDRQAVYVQAVVLDEKKNELLFTDRKILGVKIFGARAVASMLALTVDDLPPDEKRQDKKIQLAVYKPSEHIEESRIAAAANSPYALEILVKDGDEYVARPAESKEGRAYVPLKKDETYAIRIHNNSSHDAAVTLSIDGLGLFAFNEEKEMYSHVLIPAKRSGTIKGWYRTREQADAFTITGYARSAVAQSLKYPSSVGTVTATFAMAWKESEEAPEGENSRSGDIATGRGPNVDTDYRIEPRRFGRTRTSISVRYTR
jgi:hypothetical protein